MTKCNVTRDTDQTTRHTTGGTEHGAQYTAHGTRDVEQETGCTIQETVHIHVVSPGPYISVAQYLRAIFPANGKYFPKTSSLEDV